MAYVDSEGVTHVSLDEAKKGHAAKTTASRDATGAIVGDSISSRYVREQEAQAKEAEQKKKAEQAKAAEEEKQKVQYLSLLKYQQQHNAWLQKQIAAVEKERPTAQIQQPKQQSIFLNSPLNGLNLNLITPTAQAKPQQQQQQTLSEYNRQAQYNQLPAEEKDFLSRGWIALKQGYAAGEGKEYSLVGLKAPETKNTLTTSLFEKANSLGDTYDSFQKYLLSPLPGSVGKDVIKGVTSLPGYGIRAAGAIPYGVETIARNPTGWTDSVGFGLGAMAGLTVEKAKTHPGELLGELAGGVLVGKAGAAAALKVKESFSAPQFKNFVVSERASLGPQKLAYGEMQKASAPIPNAKMETYVEVGGKMYPESSIRINQVRMADNVKLTPEMENVLFSKASAKQSMQIQNRDIFSPEMTAPTKYHISGIQMEDASMRINQVRMADNVKLTPEMENVLFNKRQSPQTQIMPRGAEKTVMDRDIFSPEMTAPTKYHISSIRMKDSWFPIAASFSPILAYNLPSTAIGNKQQEKQKEDSIIYIPDVTDNTQKEDPIPIPIPDNTTISDPIPDDPMPTPPDPFGYYVPDPIFTSRGGKTMFSIDGLLDVSPGNGKRRRKTKGKTLKNVYGDPLKIKLKL
jgi:hypothetical protein